MFTKFLLTGATGFLGNTIAWILHEKGFYCKALVMRGDSYTRKLPPDIDIFYGNLLDEAALDSFFVGQSEDTCLIHCAGIVSIASKPNHMIHKVNVEGTKTILHLAAKHHIGRVVYVSSIHAIPEKPKGVSMAETDIFDENLVKGEYAKSKAMASRLAQKASKDGLNLSIVHPSGLIGPGDWRHGLITSTIMTYCKGKLPAGVRGGNNFVDVRDVANGILACVENGKPGACYVLSGHNVTVKTILEHVRSLINGKKLIYLPLPIVKMIAPIYEWIAVKKHHTPFLSPYSTYALGANACYSYDKATNAFRYCTRAIKETVEDTVKWLLETKQINIR